MNEAITPPPYDKTAVVITAIICLTVLAGIFVWRGTGNNNTSARDPTGLVIASRKVHLYQNGKFHSVLEPWTPVKRLESLPEGWVRIRHQEELYEVGAGLFEDGFAVYAGLKVETEQLEQEVEIMSQQIKTSQGIYGIDGQSGISTAELQKQYERLSATQRELTRKKTILARLKTILQVDA